MSAKQEADDLEAVRAIAEALKPFQPDEQERILRWAREKVGLGVQQRTPIAPAGAPVLTPPVLPMGGGAAHLSAPQGTDIRTFVAQKAPQSDTHFAATVAYYYQFEAPESQRKEAISAEDLQEACRKVNRDRFKRPISTLHNAHRDGILDKADRGMFRINSVGENLVAMALPAATGATPMKRRAKMPKKTAKKG